jgi:hypothetical protein
MRQDVTAATLTTEEIAYLPYLAPLSMTMATFLMNDGETSFSHMLHSIWLRLIERVNTARTVVYPLLSQQYTELTSEWVAKELAALSPAQTAAFTAATLSRWRASGLLRNEQKNRPHPDNVAALFILRVLDKYREKQWHPSVMPKDEPLWYCWRQDSPDAPVIPCPYPLPEDLPRSAFLYTTYRLAQEKPDWLPFGSLAVRWGGITIHKHTYLWNLTTEDLVCWDRSITSQVGKKALDTEAIFTRHTLANLVLLNLASELSPLTLPVEKEAIFPSPVGSQKVAEL